MAKQGNEQVSQWFQYTQWAMGIGVVLLSVWLWADARLTGGTPSVYTIFPVFGLIAFGLMWTHYIAAALRRAWGLEKVRDAYWMVSSAAVLGAILLHPLLFNYGLIRDGLGLPPASYEAAYPDKAGLVMLGTFALVLFLLYELHRWYSDRSWWKIIDKLQVVGMLAIFVHALGVGSDMKQGALELLWWFYGFTLVIAIGYMWYFDAKHKEVSDGRNQ